MVPIKYKIHRLSARAVMGYAKETAQGIYSFHLNSAATEKCKASAQVEQDDNALFYQILDELNNGKTRDITRYVTFDVDTVTAETTQITVSFPYVMYHNEEDGTAMNAGVASTTPTTILNVTVENDEEVVLGDVNQDGKVNIKDKNLITAYFNKKVELTDQQLEAADVNGDGRINIKDANLISAYFNRKISVFPAENE